MNEEIKPLALLIAARHLIDAPHHWEQGQFASDEDGYQVAPAHPDADKWCAIGALERVFLQCEPYGDGVLYMEDPKLWCEFNRAVTLMCNAIDPNEACLDPQATVINYNDTHKHAAVMAMFDRAIELAKEAS